MNLNDKDCKISPKCLTPPIYRRKSLDDLNRLKKEVIESTTRFIFRIRENLNAYVSEEGEETSQ